MWRKTCFYILTWSSWCGELKNDLSKICLLPATADKQCSYLNTNYRQQTKLNLAMIGYYKTVYKENVETKTIFVWQLYRMNVELGV